MRRKITASAMGVILLIAGWTAVPFSTASADPTGYEIVTRTVGLSENWGGTGVEGSALPGTGVAQAICPAGKVVVGGGGYAVLKDPQGQGPFSDFQSAIPLIASMPDQASNGWDVVFSVPHYPPGNFIGNVIWAKVFAICES